MNILLKYITIFIIVISILLSSNKEIHSKEKYKINFEERVEIDNYGLAKVYLKYFLENTTSETKIENFKLKLNQIKPNNLEVFVDGKPYSNYIQNLKEDLTELDFSFDDSFIGEGLKKELLIIFNENNISKKSGNILEVSIPKIFTENINEYKLVLTIPKEFSREAYISPKPSNVIEQDNLFEYLFEKDKIKGLGVNAAFGEFQVFKLNISYYLKNDSAIFKEVNIPLPPDTPYQKIYIKDINPKPIDINVDADGNWLAKYKISPLDNINVIYNGTAQLFSSPRSLFNQTPNKVIKNLGPSKYWDVENENIKLLSDSFIDVKDVYDYVVKNLNYNYLRINPKSERYGSKKALEYPNDALCTEYTDLFITLLRIKNIPAREIQGYAYTDDSNVKPLSLVADVLHSWPEYWDTDLNTWVAVDPTWESTTGNDYFTKSDMKHIAFVIHGSDSEYPLPPGSYKKSDDPKKDIFISFSEIEETKDKNYNFSYFFRFPFNPFKKIISYTISNQNSTADYNMDITIVNKEGEIISENKINSLLPLSNYKNELIIKVKPFAIGMSENYELIIDNNKFEINLNKNSIIIYHCLILALLSLIVSAFIFVKIRKK